MRTDDHIDLDWFFNWAQGDLGVKGVDPSAGGGGSSSCNPEELRMERTIDGSRRFRLIATAIKSMPMTAQAVLRDAFGQQSKALPQALRHRVARHFWSAAFSDAMTEFLKRINARATVKMRVEWLVRAEAPGVGTGVSPAEVEQLRRLAWAQAEAKVEKTVRDFGAARRMTK